MNNKNCCEHIDAEQERSEARPKTENDGEAAECFDERDKPGCEQCSRNTETCEICSSIFDACRKRPDSEKLAEPMHEKDDSDT